MAPHLCATAWGWIWTRSTQDWRNSWVNCAVWSLSRSSWLRSTRPTSRYTDTRYTTGPVSQKKMKVLNILKTDMGCWKCLSCYMLCKNRKWRVFFFTLGCFCMCVSCSYWNKVQLWSFSTVKPLFLIVWAFVKPVISYYKCTQVFNLCL